MSLVFTTSPSATINVGSQYIYTASAAENHPSWSGLSATTHFEISALRGPVSFDSRFLYASASSDKTFTLSWYPRISDVVSGDAIHAESIDLVLTVYGTSGNYTQQNLSISATTSALLKARTTMGETVGNADFESYGYAGPSDHGNWGLK